MSNKTILLFNLHDFVHNFNFVVEQNCKCII